MDTNGKGAWHDRFPYPAYPNGWFRIAHSADLAAGEIKPLSYLGCELVLFRTASGRASSPM